MSKTMWLTLGAAAVLYVMAKNAEAAKATAQAAATISNNIASAN